MLNKKESKTGDKGWNKTTQMRHQYSVVATQRSRSQQAIFIYMKSDQGKNEHRFPQTQLKSFLPSAWHSPLPPLIVSLVMNVPSLSLLSWFVFGTDRGKM